MSDICKYCHNDPDEMRDENLLHELKEFNEMISAGIFGDYEFSVWFEEKTLHDPGYYLTVAMVEEDSDNDYTDIVKLPVKYCPFCGRRLGDESGS